MRFADYLAAEAVPEWQKMYINYEALRKTLSQIPRTHVSALSLTFQSFTGKTNLRKRANAKGKNGKNVSVTSMTSSSGDMPQVIPAGHNLRGGQKNQNRASICHSLSAPEGRRRERRLSARRRNSRAESSSGDESQDGEEQIQARPSLQHGESLAVPPSAEGPSGPDGIRSPYFPTDSPDASPPPFAARRLLPTSIPDIRLEDYDVNGPMDPVFIQMEQNRLPLEERTFFTLFGNELNKVGDFYHELEIRLQTRLCTLQEQCKHHEMVRKNLNRRSSLRPDVTQPLKSFFTNLIPGGSNDGSSNAPRGDGGNRRHVSWQTNQGSAGYDAPGSAGPDQPLNFKYRASKSKLKKALLELYRGAELAKNYQILNYNGFVKILNKYETIGSWHDGLEFYSFGVENHQFVKSTTIDNLLKETENLYIKHFSGGSRSRGIKKLRISDHRFDTFHGSALRCGIFGGMTFPMIIYLIWIMQSPKTWLDVPYLSYALKIFGGIYLMNAMLILFGLNIYIWGRNRINYKFIYEFDPRDNLSNVQFMEIPLFLFFLTTLFVCLTVTNPFYLTIRSSTYPGILILCMLALFIFPLKVFHFSARMWFLNNVKRVMVTPLLKVKFKDFMLADQLTSLTYFITGLHMAGCAYTHKWKNMSESCHISHTWLYPGLAMIPSLWRFMQCMRRGILESHRRPRNFTNAFKYALSVLVHWLAANYRIYPSRTNKIIWLFFAVASTLVSYSWDILMDWSMFEMVNGRPVLRRERKYSWTWTYWFAIISNFVIRFGWMSSLTGSTVFLKDRNHYEVIAFGAAFIDAFRRFQWNIYRMENEHVNNCGAFRATKDVPLPYDTLPRGGGSENVGLNSQDSGADDNFAAFGILPPTPPTPHAVDLTDNEKEIPDSRSIAETVETRVGERPNWRAEEMPMSPPRRPTSVVVVVPEKDYY
ncbi:Signal transduction protein [Tieghemiomyces parasiticus]|uniref:Signal transduction protein n=1 Tax=Tieghemiomyces parasiticus TaxID=78921 RepID=A0A9W8DTS3_9FUNG|nr:Signal transduction protein [Tieghemiomyces parasiticus]